MFVGDAMFAVKFTLIFIILIFSDKTVAEWRIVKPLAKLSTISYSIYLIHFFVSPKLFSVCGRAFNLNNTAESLTVVFIIVLPITIFVSYIFYRYFERPFYARQNV